jgi:cyclohexyl-isocyanide hydratase
LTLNCHFQKHRPLLTFLAFLSSTDHAGTPAEHHMPSNDNPLQNEIDRRTMTKLLGGALLGAGMSAVSAAQTETATHTPHQHPPAPANAPSVSVLIYPQMVMLDLIGPLTAFQIMGSRIELVWKDRNPVMTDTHIPVTPTHDFSTASKGADVFLIPGGTMGTAACMKDSEVLEYVRTQGESARYVSSVCTGSLVLAAAGLLKGYRATSLWAVADLLPLLGAQPVHERLVVDRNRITAGGVTAGIDFGLMLAAKLTDEMTAKRIQLTLEYSPQPPFRAGTPAEAGPELTTYTKNRRKGMDAEVEAAARLAARRLDL